jgi:hypothetical protein
MIEHVNDLLGAYVDGELRGPRLRQVEEHLAHCAACSQELEELRGLSSLLQKSVPMEAFMPADQFAANMVLRLSATGTKLVASRPAAPAPQRKPLEFLWWLAPAGVLGAWFFLQTVFTVSNVISTANLTGLTSLLGNTITVVQNTPQQSLWFSATMGLFGSQIQGNGRQLLDVLNNASLFGSSFAAPLLWQAGIALVYWIWLGLWWNRRRGKVAVRRPVMPQH